MEIKPEPGGGREATAVCGKKCCLTRWALIAVAGLALAAGTLFAAAWHRPWLGALLLLLGSWVILRLLGPRFRLLSVKIPSRLVLVVLGLWIALALSEIALRLFLFQSFADVDRAPSWRRTMGFQYDRLLGWFPIPNSRLMFAADRTISIAHNSRGFRDIEPTFDDRLRVLFLGDSFVWGFNVEATNRFTELLRVRHPEWQVYNFGVAGYSTGQEYLMLREHFEEYRPRIVFLVFCTENDDLNNCSNTSIGRYYKPYFRPGPEGLKLCGVPVPRSERVFCVQHPLLSKLYISRLLVRAYGNLCYPPPRYDEPPTKHLLQALRDYLSVQGAAFCVGLTRSAPEIEKFLRKSGIPCLDLSTNLRVGNDVHWSPAGHAFVANQIENLLQQEILPGLTPAPARPRSVEAPR